MDEEARHDLEHVRRFCRDECGLRRQAGERTELLDMLDGDVVGVLLSVVEELIDAQRALSYLFVIQPERGVS